MKTDLFQSCGHCWVFQICWHIECSTFTASSFSFWNSSTGISSIPLNLSVVMLPKAHLTSHSRLSGSRWVIIPLWLSEWWRSFLYSSSVYYCHLFLISSASVRSRPFLSFIEPICAWNIPLVSLIFLKRLLVFPIVLFSSIYLHWSLMSGSRWMTTSSRLSVSLRPFLFSSSVYSCHLFFLISSASIRSLLLLSFIEPFITWNILLISPRRCRRHMFDLWVGKILWRKKWQPTSVFLPGKSHGQRIMSSHSPGDLNE